MVKDILHNHIKEHCSRFLKESNGIPVCKMLSTYHDDQSRIKIRYRSTSTHILDEVLDIDNLYNKALFTQKHFTEGGFCYYVFPTDDFKFIYANKEVENLKTMIDLILNKMGNNENSIGIIRDVIAQRYKSDDLREGLAEENNIIFYNIPAFYIMNADTAPYDKIYRSLL